MSDLLNNFLYQKNQQNNVAPLPAIKIDLNTQNKVKPLDGKGHMLPSHILGSPIEYAKDLKKDVLSIGKGVKGQANDHELGRMNDLATKLGALGLAAYLIVKNPLKLKKSMELVGVASFFGSMALWPKLAIQAPLKKKFGVDIHQKYEDSYGRKKTFFQDPQYVPWDLVSKEDLNKMGDKLNIPTDINNREEVIKQKAQKVAVQGNTLWMMTAGFATPIFSALACNVAERGIGKFQGEMTQRTSKKIFDQQLSALKNQDYAPINLGQYKVQNKKAQQIFNEIFATGNLEQRLDATTIEKIVNAVNEESNLKMGEAIGKELKALSTTTGEVDSEFIANLYKKNQELFSAKGITTESLAQIFDQEGMKEAIKQQKTGAVVDAIGKLVDNEKQVIDSAKIADDLATILLPNNAPIIKKAKVTEQLVSDDYVEKLIEKAEKEGKKLSTFELKKAKSLVQKSKKAAQQEAAELAAKSKVATNLINRDSIEFLFGNNQNTFINLGISKEALADAILGKKESVEITTANLAQIAQDVAKKATKTNGLKIEKYKKQISETLFETINENTPKLGSIKGKVSDMLKIVDNFIDNKKMIKTFVDANVADRAETFVANQWAEVNKEFMKALNFNSKELVAVKAGNDTASKIIAEHLEDLAKPENADRYNLAMKKLSAAISKYNKLLSDANIQNPANEAIETIFDSAAKDFRANGFEHLANFIDSGENGFAPGSYKRATQSFIQDRIKGAQACYYRMLQTMDLYKRIQDGTLEKEFELLNGKLVTPEFLEARKSFKEVEKAFPELVEKSKLHPGKAGWLKDCYKKFNNGEISLDEFKQIIKNEMGGNTTSQLLGIFDSNIAGIENSAKTLDSKTILHNLYLNSDKIENIEDSFDDVLKADLLSKIEEYKKGTIDFDTLKNSLKTRINGHAVSLEEKFAETIDKFAKAKKSFFDFGPLAHYNNVIETFEANPVDTDSMFKEILKKAKETMLSYKITDHTEKLNDVGEQTYKSVMGLLFDCELSPETQKSVGADVIDSLKSYQKEFIDKIANWEYWYKSGHVYNGITNGNNGSLRHALVGSSIEDMATKAASSTFNTNKWLKTFGGAALILTGVTLAAGKFFGKMKKEDVYSGVQK